MNKKEAKLFLEGINIFVIRNLGRMIGVSHPTTKAKSELIDNVIEILTGEAEPNEQSRRGRPVKMGSGLYDHCETVLEQLKSILGISDSLIYKNIESQQKLASLCKIRPRLGSTPLTFEQHVDGILSLCEDQSDLEIIANVILGLSIAKASKGQNAQLFRQG